MFYENSRRRRDGPDLGLRIDGPGDDLDNCDYFHVEIKKNGQKSILFLLHIKKFDYSGNSAVNSRLVN